MIGINQQPGGISYPFIDTGNTDVKEILKYIKYLQVITNKNNITYPINISKFTATQNTTGEITIEELLLLDNNNTILLEIRNNNTTLPYKIYTNSTTSQYKIITITDTEDQTLFNTKLILYIDNTVKDETQSINITNSLPINNRACFTLYGSIKNLNVEHAVDDNDETNISQTTANNPKIISKNNITLDVNNDSLTINYNLLEAIQKRIKLIKSINFVTPADTGNIELTHDACANVENDLIQITDNDDTVLTEETQLKISNRCKSCCDCDEMINYYDTDLRDLREEIQALCDKADKINKKYIAKYKSQK